MNYKIWALISLICLALSFGGTGEWLRIILIIGDGILLFMDDEQRFNGDMIWEKRKLQQFVGK